MASLVHRNLSALLIKRWHVGKQAMCWYTQEPAKPTTSTKATQTPPPAPAADNDISTYKVPEYYAYNTTSYYDIDVDMEKHRIAQPSKYPPKA